LQKNLATWRQINGQDIPAVNKKLQEIHLVPLPVAGRTAILACE
jgi:hypothetical protein